jgi:SAM-dependent methyltransferase
VSLDGIFFQIHRDLPREGPGDATSTRRAYARTRRRQTDGRILDVGCGPGAQTLDLVAVSPAAVVALDTHAPYLEVLRERAGRAGVGRRVQAVRGSMTDMPFADGTFDIIWAEGSIYLAGFERGLRAWRPLLRPGGYVAATHLSWLSADVPEEPRTFWARAFPEMRTIDDNIAVAIGCGYELVDRFVLPESAWWSGYYGPMEARLAALRIEHRADSAALAVIESTAEQIHLYRRFSHSYGYVFYILRKTE